MVTRVFRASRRPFAPRSCTAARRAGRWMRPEPPFRRGPVMTGSRRRVQWDRSHQVVCARCRRHTAGDKDPVQLAARTAPVPPPTDGRGTARRSVYARRASSHGGRGAPVYTVHSTAVSGREGPDCGSTDIVFSHPNSCPRCYWQTSVVRLRCALSFEMND